jgi:hypothetical protein
MLSAIIEGEVILMKKRSPNRKWTTKYVVLIILILIVATISMVNATINLAKNTFDVRFIAGSDSKISPVTYPAATVTVASTYTTATVTFSLFPSGSSNLQSATCYTDLLRIKNLGSTAIINGITLGNIAGASNLGNLIVYFYATQTDNPQTGTPIAYASITNSSSGTINLLSNPYILGASSIGYIEVVGCASAAASVGSIVSFSVNLQIGSTQSEKVTAFGTGSLLLWRSAGTYSGHFKTPILFGFNVKSNGGVVSGELGLTIRHMDSCGHVRVYQVKSNDPAAFNVLKDITQTLATANFTSATIRDITHRVHPITITNNANVLVSLTDYSKKPDTIAITVTSPSGQLYFSSNWNANTTVEQNLFSGTISIG